MKITQKHKRKKSSLPQFSLKKIMKIHRTRRAIKLKKIKVNKLKAKKLKPKKPHKQSKGQQIEQLKDISMKNQLGITSTLTPQQNQIIDLFGIDRGIDIEDEINQVKEAYQQRQSKNVQTDQLFYQIGLVLKKYRSGALPQAIKRLGQLPQFQKYLQLSKPQNWSPQAIHSVTKALALSLDNQKAAIYFQRFLLPSVKADIQVNKKLNYHLYQALKHAAAKANSWIKGIIFPLCKQSTNRQIYLICVLLKKVSFPAISAAVCLIKLAQMPYSYASICFIKTLIQKKYSLPERVINTLIQYFNSFQNYKDQLGVVWHQCLLQLCQFYKQYINEMGKGSLRKIVNKHHHYLISKQILKVLM